MQLYQALGSAVETSLRALLNIWIFVASPRPSSKAQAAATNSFTNQDLHLDFWATNDTCTLTRLTIAHVLMAKLGDIRPLTCRTSASGLSIK